MTTDKVKPDRAEIEAALGAIRQFSTDAIRFGIVSHKKDIDYALSVLTEALAERGWRPIESAPRDGTRVIVAWPTGDTWIPYLIGEAHYIAMLRQWHRPMNCGIAINPTHWKPLPEPPHSER